MKRLNFMEDRSKYVESEIHIMRIEVLVMLTLTWPIEGKRETADN